MSAMIRFLFWLRQILRGVWYQLLAVFTARATNCRCPFLIENKMLATITKLEPRINGRKANERVPLPFDDIPTAKGLPIVGTLFDLLAAGAAPKLHKYIDKRHRELGLIFRERLGGTQDAVFVASASLMRSVFLYEGQYPKHPLPEAWMLYNTENRCERGLFFMDGAEWLQNRRILNRCLLNGNMEWIHEHIEECNERLISNWRLQASNGKGDEYVAIADLEQQLYRWSIQVICCIMFGSMTTVTIEIEAALENFSRIVHKIFQCSALLMNVPAKLAKLLNLSMWQDFVQNVAHILEKGGEIIDMFIALNVDNSNTPVLDSERLYDKLQHAGMPLAMIKRIFVDLVIAAGDTTAYSTEWALYLLSQNSELQQRIAKEAALREDCKEVTTTRGLIKEALRLYPVAPFIGRYLACDAVLGGYCVKKGTLVLLSLYTAGRDPAHFPEPLSVTPDRWKRNEKTGQLQGVLQAHGSLPFAIGNRACIGRRLFTAQLEAFISAISQNFELKCLNEGPVDCILRLVTVPDQPLQLAMKLRSEDY